jgi:hypothetical protein
LYIAVLLILAGCNLNTQQATPTAVTAPPSETNAPTTVPAITPAVTALATLPPPPLPTFNAPPTVPPGVTAIGTGLPTVSATGAASRHELQARANDTVGVNYVVTMTRGTLRLTMQGPDGVVWQKTFTASETGREEVTVQEGGTYEILAEVQNFDGNYSLSWD